MQAQMKFFNTMCWWSRCCTLHLTAPILISNYGGSTLALQQVISRNNNPTFGGPFCSIQGGWHNQRGIPTGSETDGEP